MDVPELPEIIIKWNGKATVEPLTDKKREEIIRMIEGKKERKCVDTS